MPSGAPSASIAQPRSAVSIVHLADRAAPSAPPRGRSPPASIDAIRSGASVCSSASGATRRRGAPEQRARRLAAADDPFDAPTSLRMAASRASLVLADERQPQLPGVASRAGRRGRSNRRSPNKGRSSTATRRRRARSRSAPMQAGRCGESIGARACHARSCGGASLISRSGSVMPGRGRQAEPPGCRADRPGPIRWSPRGRCSAPAPTTFSASVRSIPPIRPRRRAPIDLRGRGFRLAGKRRAHRVDQLDDVRIDLLRCRPAAGTAPAGSALASALCTPTWNILRREAVDVDAGDDHPRGVGLAHPQQQPGALRGPIDRVHVPRRARACASSALRKRDMRPARRQSACPSGASGSRGRPRCAAPRRRRRGRARPDRAVRQCAGRAARGPDIRPAAEAARSFCRR